MGKKDNFWNNTYLGYILKNILIAGGIILGLVLAALLFIQLYTNHGESEKVPNLRGTTLEEARLMLDRHNLKGEIIDSVYLKDKKLGTVIEQNPVPGSIVKPGRPIYLIINSKSVRKITLPDVRDVSLRQAEAMIKSLGVNIATVQYASSEYKDLVLDIKYKGQTLLPGSKIPEGSSVVLIAGDGYGSSNASGVPSLKGLDLASATEIISAGTFLLGGITYDVAPNGDENQYIVYQQRPEPGEPVATGVAIDLFLSKDRSRLNEALPPPVRIKSQDEKQHKEKVEDIEEFF